MIRHPSLFSAIASLVTACASSSASPPPAPLPPAVSARWVPAEMRPMPRALSVTGTLVANRKSDVAANAAGRIVKTLVERGDFVKEGAPLVQLDARSAALSETEAHANSRNANTLVEQANAECRRNEALYKKGAISKEEWERGNAQCQTTLGTAEAAKARAELASKMLGDATVRAPFAGMIGERYANVGEYLQPFSRVAALVELDPLRLQLSVDEPDVGAIHQDQKVTFQVDSFPGESFSGAIRYIDPTLRAMTRDLIVEATVENAQHRLRPGMFATAQLQLPDAAAVTVPKNAVRLDSGPPRLFAVVRGAAEERIVQIGPEREGVVAILDGVKAGDAVIVEPGDQVKDGVPVKDGARVK